MEFDQPKKVTLTDKTPAAARPYRGGFPSIKLGRGSVIKRGSPYSNPLFFSHPLAHMYPSEEVVRKTYL
jgi:hypothetical protein